MYLYKRFRRSLRCLQYLSFAEISFYECLFLIRLNRGNQNLIALLEIITFAIA